MNDFCFSRLVKLDVKWVSELQGNEHTKAWKSNPFYELIMVTEGPVHLQIGEEKLSLSSGECCLLRPWELHTSWQPIEARCGFYWTQFIADPAPAYRQRGDEHVSEHESAPNTAARAGAQDLRITGIEDSDHILLPRRFRPTGRFELLALFEQLLQQFREPEGYYRYRCTQLLGQIVGVIADQWLEQLPAQSESSASYLLYRRIVNRLDESYAEDVGSAALEADMQHSYAYLCQVFKKYAGLTIGAYVQRLRIQRAKHLLAHTSLTVAEIARQCGFEDPFYFSRAFKKIEGIGPSGYRTSAEG